MLTLEIEKREKGQALEALRKSGKMPAVFYGPKEKTTPITVSQAEFIKVWKKAGESSIIELVAKGEQHDALIHDIDMHPVTGAPRHADFYVIEKGKKVEVAVPIVFDGVAPAVKDKGGILVKVMRELEIEATPKDLPRDIHVDISSLTDLESVIEAKDIKLPQGVTLRVGPEEVIAAIAEAKEEVVEEAPVDLSSIEVEKKGKEAKEGGEEGASTDEAK